MISLVLKILEESIKYKYDRFLFVSHVGLNEKVAE